jgi:2-dehydro-3-deoxygluconokinase
MNKVCCFGELLLRLAPGDDWTGDRSMPVFVGGAELNVATALANWNIPVKYITALPDNYFSKQILSNVSGKGINTEDTIFSGNRIGIYYLPLGSELKNTGVIYDRECSSFSQLKPGLINWKKVLDGCHWFHFSAISAALNEHIAAICKEAVEAATEMDLTISVDLNYRNKLWQYGKQPVDVMPGLLKHCHVVMGNTWSAESLLGIKSTITESEGKTKEQLIDAAGKSMLQIHQQYANVSTIAYTYRLDDLYWAMMQHGSEMQISKEFTVSNTVDRVGSGDCFMAALIYGLLEKKSVKIIIDFAAAAAVGKLQEAGDVTRQTIEKIEERIINE